MVSLQNQVNHKPVYCKANGDRLIKVTCGNIIDFRHKDDSMCLCTKLVNVVPVIELKEAA